MAEVGAIRAAVPVIAVAASGVTVVAVLAVVVVVLGDSGGGDRGHGRSRERERDCADHRNTPRFDIAAAGTRGRLYRCCCAPLAVTHMNAVPLPQRFIA